MSTEVKELANGVIALCNHSELTCDEVILALANCIGAALLSASKDVPASERAEFFQVSLAIAENDIADAIMANVIGRSEK